MSNYFLTKKLQHWNSTQKSLAIPGEGRKSSLWLVLCSGHRARNSHPWEPVRILLGLCNHSSNLDCFRKLEFKLLGTRWWEIVRLSTLMSQVELGIQTQKVFWLVLVESLSHVWLCNPMDCSTLGFTVHHYLPEFAETHVHWVGDAIQPSHPLLPPSPPAFNLSQHQGLSQWFGSSHQVAKVLELQLQHQSFQWILGLTSCRIDWLDLLAVQGTLKGLLQHHRSNSLALSFLYGPTLTSLHDHWKHHSFD